MKHHFLKVSLALLLVMSLLLPAALCGCKKDPDAPEDTGTGTLTTPVTDGQTPEDPTLAYPMLAMIGNSLLRLEEEAGENDVLNNVLAGLADGGSVTFNADLSFLSSMIPGAEGGSLGQIVLKSYIREDGGFVMQLNANIMGMTADLLDVYGTTLADPLVVASPLLLGDTVISGTAEELVAFVQMLLAPLMNTGADASATGILLTADEDGTPELTYDWDNADGELAVLPGPDGSDGSLNSSLDKETISFLVAQAEALGAWAASHEEALTAVASRYLTTVCDKLEAMCSREDATITAGGEAVAVTNVKCAMTGTSLADLLETLWTAASADEDLKALLADAMSSFPELMNLLLGEGTYDRAYVDSLFASGSEQMAEVLEALRASADTVTATFSVSRKDGSLVAFSMEMPVDGENVSMLMTIGEDVSATNSITYSVKSGDTAVVDIAYLVSENTDAAYAATLTVTAASEDGPTVISVTIAYDRATGAYTLTVPSGSGDLLQLTGTLAADENGFTATVTGLTVATEEGPQTIPLSLSLTGLYQDNTAPQTPAATPVSELTEEQYAAMRTVLGQLMTLFGGGN